MGHLSFLPSVRGGGSTRAPHRHRRLRRDPVPRRHRPAEVFHHASALTGGDGYAVELVGASARTTSGLELGPLTPLGALGPVDTLLVAGGAGARDAEHDGELVPWIGRAAPRARRVASVCTGAFLLARAGLLDGRRATTHWAWCELLARRHPLVTVERDPIFVRDGDVWTSAGVTAGMDLALALVEDDHGPEVALEVARGLVLFVRRPGGQAQFSAQLSTQAARRDPLREVQGWIADHLDADLSVGALAARAHMSPRNFARAFAREVGMTPAAYVETVRVEGRPGAPGGRRGAAGHGRPRLRLRHRRDHAAGLPPPHGRRARRLPQPFPARRRHPPCRSSSALRPVHGAGRHRAL